MRGKMHMAAPLPFVGQKRMFAKEYIKILPQFNDKTVFVDLFGGSGLLSHITKHLRPEATVYITTTTTTASDWHIYLRQMRCSLICER